MTAPESDVAVTSSVMVYIKLVIDKKYSVLAQLFGGMRDNTVQLTVYDPAKPWWNNPLIAYDELAVQNADIIGHADADAITGQGAIGNVTINVSMVPHADVTIKTIPKSDALKGTITATISIVAQFYDGEWVEMVHVADRKVTFSVNTCDPRQRPERIAKESRTIPAFTLERYTRDEQRWEPKTQWPKEPKSGDWRVAIDAKNVTLEITGYQYAQPADVGVRH